MYIVKFSFPGGVEFFWGPFANYSLAEDYICKAKDQQEDLGISYNETATILKLNTPV